VCCCRNLQPEEPAAATTCLPPCRPTSKRPPRGLDGPRVDLGQSPAIGRGTVPVGLLWPCGRPGRLKRERLSAPHHRADDIPGGAGLNGGQRRGRSSERLRGGTGWTRAQLTPPAVGLPVQRRRRGRPGSSATAAASEAPHQAAAARAAAPGQRAGCSCFRAPISAAQLGSGGLWAVVSAPAGAPSPKRPGRASASERLAATATDPFVQGAAQRFGGWWPVAGLGRRAALAAAGPATARSCQLPGKAWSSSSTHGWRGAATTSGRSLQQPAGRPTLKRNGEAGKTGGIHPAGSGGRNKTTVRDAAKPLGGEGRATIHDGGQEGGVLAAERCRDGGPFRPRGR